jgi:hypothetical protein
MNRFAVSSDGLSSRLAPFDLDARSRQVIEWYARRYLQGAVLFVDEPWAELDYQELATDEGVALAVFAAPVEVDGGLALTNEILLGDRVRRDAACFVFLDVVRCQDLALVPDTHALFTGGLEVARLAGVLRGAGRHRGGRQTPRSEDRPLWSRRRRGRARREQGAGDRLVGSNAMSSLRFSA